MAGVPPLPTTEEIKRRIRDMERKLGIKRKPPKPIPGVGEELWPGGPSTQTGDIRIAKKKHRPSRTRLA